MIRWAVRKVFRLGMYASALVVGGVIGAHLMTERVHGSGVVATEPRPVGNVAQVELEGVGELVVTRSDRPGLSVTADDNLLPLLETVSAGNKLVLRVRDGVNITTHAPIVYRLSVRSLEKVAVTGAGSVSGDGLAGDELAVKVTGAGNVALTGLDVRDLKVSLSGAGNATLGGTAGSFTAKVSGAGKVKAADLKAGAVDANISGAGGMTVWATDSLKARVSGAGGVKYKGTPSVERKVSGAGSVAPLNG
ncbi:MAG: DUF2807 domain-containing protein [Gemmataceae bacterium]|nr:DUF2807 domain-containing protein [Gemmataceae bacterium]